MGGNIHVRSPYHELVWQIAGQQGEGIDSTGDVLASALNGQGYYLYGYREFSSRIKGGHTQYRLRISHNPVGAISHKLHILIALDQQSFTTREHALVPEGLLITDEDLDIGNTRTRHNVVVAPLAKLAEEQGNRIVRNMVALGVSAAVMNMDPEVFSERLRDRFGKKGDAIVNLNIGAVKAGYHWAVDAGLSGRLPLKPGDGNSRLFMIGNHAAALGAVMGGCRFLAAYPITPATEIMEYLSRTLPDVGGVVVQTEDEIAAVTMAIGAAYAGARAITSTSGPGVSLMAEAIGLAGMTETPIVIVDAQRAGPSTGLPTKHEQSDLLSAILGTHGEIPKVVMTPNTVSECFYQTARAFNIAEKYQCPVIVLSDVALSLGKQTVEPFDVTKLKVFRGKLLDEPEETLEPGALFQRYAFTQSGLSPRTIPGTRDGIHKVTGLEHDETGMPTESPALRIAMMDKRLTKIPDMLPNSTHYQGPAQPDYLLVGYGSTFGAIDEARQMLEDEGFAVGHLQLKIVWPFPIAEMDFNMEGAKNIFIIENNATGQLQHLLNMFSPYDRKTMPIRKYDGRPFMPLEIYEQVRGGV
ncbi:2-oxoacid:acceptor oxidoreductase subunit alpha [Metallumcola ferriviriculae]|uniref:2-oxoacid:acceptor oxidoreductase subunit alpha n=1 Tax=Metallumcola ferriviriculae TaxID=3039180 RepID=A0AAU0ULN9_9FIRM|nr:2-oxoacid:acceptor oxidoreductase subunit alpha [Desulfitibacteraceae bacterium MK1]